MMSNYMYTLLVWLCCVLCVQYAQAQEKYMFQPIGHNEPIPIGIRQSWGWDNVDTSGRWCEPITPDNLFTTYKGLIQLGKHDSLALKEKLVFGKGETRYDYSHYYKGILVHHSYFDVTTWNGKTTRIGNVIQQNLDIDTTKVLITQSDMKQMVIDSAKAHKLSEYKLLGFNKVIYSRDLWYRYSLLELTKPLKVWALEVLPFTKQGHFREVVLGFDANP
jgi:hypothetical protein